MFDPVPRTRFARGLFRLVTGEFAAALPESPRLGYNVALGKVQQGRTVEQRMTVGRTGAGR